MTVIDVCISGLANSDVYCYSFTLDDYVVIGSVEEIAEEFPLEKVYFVNGDSTRVYLSKNLEVLM